MDAGAVPLLVLCIQEPELTLKRIAASALSDICKHSPELAQAVVDGGAVAYLRPGIVSPDGKLKRQVCSCLAQICKHSVDLAEVVVEAEIFPQILNLLKDMDVYVRKNAATCIREVAKHTPELAQLIVNAGGVGAMVDYVTEASGNARLPGIMTLGYISAFSETLALAVIVSKGIPPLINAVVTEPEDHIKSASAWSLGQVGRHSPDHAKALADANALPKLLAVYLHEACRRTSRPKPSARSRRSSKSACTFPRSSRCCTTRRTISSRWWSRSLQRSSRTTWPPGVRLSCRVRCRRFSNWRQSPGLSLAIWSGPSPSATPRRLWTTTARLTPSSCWTSSTLPRWDSSKHSRHRTGGLFWKQRARSPGETPATWRTGGKGGRTAGRKGQPCRSAL